MIKPIAATVSLSHAYDRQCQCPSCTARERSWTKMKDPTKEKKDYLLTSRGDWHTGSLNVWG